ncbi:MAG: DCC1-like thiol-disulfide oxidoreductase family protein [Chitinophagaceae bacterium]
MKTENNLALLYDDNCPLCAAYTKAFIKTGLLSREKRLAFSTINIRDFEMDINRARHEIPLVNMKTGDVKYGVDALAEILNQRMPFVKPILCIGSVYWFFKKLYSFISYNRKIIVAKPSFSKSCFDCSPDYSFKHRIALVFFTWTATAFLLMQIGKTWFPPADIAWFFGWPIATLILSADKTQQQSADIWVHSGITMLLSTIIFSISLNFFSWLFTFSMPVIVVSCIISGLLFRQQISRRMQFYMNEFSA